MNQHSEDNNPLDKLEQTSSDLCKEDVLFWTRLVLKRGRSVYKTPEMHRGGWARKVTPTGFPHQRALMPNQLHLSDDEPSRVAASGAKNTASDVRHCASKARLTCLINA